jgi:hypothetical protein
MEEEVLGGISTSLEIIVCIFIFLTNKKAFEK